MIEIGNLAEESALRRVVVGHRNYLCAAGGTGDKRAAIICALVGTAKLNHDDQETWQRYVLTPIANHLAI